VAAYEAARATGTAWRRVDKLLTPSRPVDIGGISSFYARCPLDLSTYGRRRHAALRRLTDGSRGEALAVARKKGKVSRQQYLQDSRYSIGEGARATEQREEREAQRHRARFWTKWADEATSFTRAGAI